MAASIVRTFHDKCIDPDFREGHYVRTVTAMPGATSGMMKTERIHQYTLNLEKRSTKRSRNKRRKRRDSSIGGSSKCIDKEYQSFSYNNIEYMVGDDVVVKTPLHEEGEWGVGRITKILHSDSDKIPRIKLIWFLRASEGLQFMCVGFSICDCHFSLQPIG